MESTSLSEVAAARLTMQDFQRDPSSPSTFGSTFRSGLGSGLMAGALLALTLTGCTLRGSGTEASEVRELESFDSLDVGGVVEVVVHVDPNVAQKVELHADDNIIGEVLTTVSGSELEVSMDVGMVRPQLPIKLEIWVPKLIEIDASGASDIEVTGLHGKEFELEVSGAADIRLAGTVDSFEVDSSGASKLEAKQLEAKHVELDLSGAGKADVFASESLEADVSGAGKVRYFGNPDEVGREVSGSGKIEPG